MHRSRLCYITIDVNDFEIALKFWKAALNAEQTDDETWEGSVYRRIKVPHSNMQILLQLVPEEKVSKTRMHIDIETDDIDAEAERLILLGAKKYRTVDELGFRFHIMQDPFGNEFCILQTEFPELLETKSTTWKSVK